MSTKPLLTPISSKRKERNLLLCSLRSPTQWQMVVTSHLRTKILQHRNQIQPGPNPHFRRMQFKESTQQLQFLMFASFTESKGRPGREDLPQYTPQNNGVAGAPIVVVQSSLYVTPLKGLKEIPAWIDCPFCRERTQTRVQKGASSTTRQAFQSRQISQKSLSSILVSQPCFVVSSLVLAYLFRTCAIGVRMSTSTAPIAIKWLHIGHTTASYKCRSYLLLTSNPQFMRWQINNRPDLRCLTKFLVAICNITQIA